MMQVTGQIENFIVNHSFIQQLEKDIKKYDILYLCAPLGWGKDQLAETICERYSGENLVILEKPAEDSLQMIISKLSLKEKKIYLVPALEKVVESGQEDLIWKLIDQKKRGDVFVFLSAMEVPEKLLPSME